MKVYHNFTKGLPLSLSPPGHKTSLSCITARTMLHSTRWALTMLFCFLINPKTLLHRLVNVCQGLTKELTIFSSNHKTASLHPCVAARMVLYSRNCVYLSVTSFPRNRRWQTQRGRSCASIQQRGCRCAFLPQRSERLISRHAFTRKSTGSYICKLMAL